MKETDIAWAAGFIDGEGCIRIYTRYANKNKQRPIATLFVSCGQSINRPLEKLQGLFGGTLSNHPARGLGHGTSYQSTLRSSGDRRRPLTDDEIRSRLFYANEISALNSGSGTNIPSKARVTMEARI